MNLNIPKGVLTGDDVQNVFKLAKERDEIFKDCIGEKSCSVLEISMF